MTTLKFYVVEDNKLNEIKRIEVNSYSVSYYNYPEGAFYVSFNEEDGPELSSMFNDDDYLGSGIYKLTTRKGAVYYIKLTGEEVELFELDHKTMEIVWSKMEHFFRTIEINDLEKEMVRRGSEGLVNSIENSIKLELEWDE